MKRFFAFLVWIPLYAKELLLANWALAKTLFLVPNEELRPSFYAYDVRDLGPWERLFLAHLITLTPGTTSADLIDHEHTLVVHGIDVGDVESARRDITERLKGPLLAWTRS